MTTLPPGYASRPATASDIADITKLVIACDIAEYGAPDYEEDDVREDWARPRFELARDTWLVHDADGQLRGYGITWDKDPGREVSADFFVDPVLPTRPIGDWLDDRIAERAAELAATTGGCDVRVWTSPTSADRIALLTEHGYKYARTFRRMEADFGEQPPPAPTDATTTIRQYAGPHDDVAIHSVIERGFAEHYGHVPESFADWHQRVVQAPSWVPDLILLAERDGTLVGTLLGQRHEGDKGWIRSLTVLPEYRGQGVAKALLLTVFRRFHDEGFGKVALGVDSGNETGAIALYERVGMRATLRWDNYRRTVTS